MDDLAATVEQQFWETPEARDPAGLSGLLSAGVIDASVERAGLTEDC